MTMNETSRRSSFDTQAESRRLRNNFFSHHGPWAPGVRLFRTLRFGAKAGLISLAFLLPLGLLAFAYVPNSQETMAFARHELAGVAVIAQLEPWMIEVQKQRRLLLPGLSTRVDLDAIAERINGLLNQIAQGAQEQSKGIGQVGNSVQELDRATQQNAAMVEQTAAAASSLRDQAQGLAEEVARFKMPA